MTEQPNRLDAGRALRREVLGADYVDAKSATSWAFAGPFADIVTEHVWGTVWQRPGLSRRDRSLLNLGMLVALNRSDELTLHIRAAINNGLTPDEIREAFIQAAAYCGAPAGLEAFRCARAAFDELGLDFQAGSE